jgi:hypothetical protein
VGNSNIGFKIFFDLQICWRLADERFRGCMSKYDVTYHLWGFLGWEIQIFGLEYFFDLNEFTFWPQNLLEAG